MDRLLPLVDFSIEVRDGRLRHPRVAGGKQSKVVLISTCGFPEIESFDPLIAHIKEKCANSDSEFTGALLRPAGPAMASMLRNGAPVGDILDAARDAGRQLARDGSISEDTLGIISRPIISKEAMMQIVNQMMKGGVKNSVSTGEARKQNGKSPSQTAEWMALIRAGESRLPESERICYDPLAIRFVGKDMLDFVTRNPEKLKELDAEHERMVPGRCNSIVARVRYFDDTVKTALNNGLEQLVVLGAGYDSRAYRIDGLDKIKVFEVDHPATQRIKKEKILEIFSSLPGHVTYVPVDFASEKLEQRLLESGYDPSQKTLFLMEGLLMYLDYWAVDQLLSFIAHNSGKGSTIVFDYIDGSVVDGTCGKEAGMNWQKMVTDIGEPFLFGIKDGDVKTFLARRGFTNIKNVTSEDYKKAYFHGKNADRVMNTLDFFAYAVVK